MSTFSFLCLLLVLYRMCCHLQCAIVNQSPDVNISINDIVLNIKIL